MGNPQRNSSSRNSTRAWLYFLRTAAHLPENTYPGSDVSPFENLPHPGPLPEEEGIGGGLPPFLCGEDALDETAGRESLPVGNGHDPPAVPFDDRLAGDRVRLPVATLDEDVRPEAADERQRRVVVEHGDVIDGLQRREQRHAALLVHDRP